MIIRVVGPILLSYRLQLKMGPTQFKMVTSVPLHHTWCLSVVILRTFERIPLRRRLIRVGFARKW